MASYSGRFISNLEKDNYVGYGANKCQLRDDKFTYQQVSKHNRADDCLVSVNGNVYDCLLYTSPSPRDRTRSRMPSSA